MDISDKKSVLMVLILAVIVLVLMLNQGKFRGGMTSEQVTTLMEDKGAVLIDVRTKGEFMEGHIPNSVNIPVDNIEEGMKQAYPDKDTPIILYCRSGARSKNAASKLKTMGYTEIYDFGGISRWSGELER